MFLVFRCPCIRSPPLPLLPWEVAQRAFIHYKVARNGGNRPYRQVPIGVARHNREFIILLMRVKTAGGGHTRQCRGHVAKFTCQSQPQLGASARMQQAHSNRQKQSQQPANAQPQSRATIRRVITQHHTWQVPDRNRRCFENKSTRNLRRGTSLCLDLRSAWVAGDSTGATGAWSEMRKEIRPGKPITDQTCNSGDQAWADMRGTHLVRASCLHTDTHCTVPAMFSCQQQYVDELGVKRGGTKYPKRTLCGDPLCLPILVSPMTSRPRHHEECWIGRGRRSIVGRVEVVAVIVGEILL